MGKAKAGVFTGNKLNKLLVNLWFKQSNATHKPSLRTGNQQSPHSGNIQYEQLRSFLGYTLQSLNSLPIFKKLNLLLKAPSGP